MAIAIVTLACCSVDERLTTTETTESSGFETDSEPTTTTTITTNDSNPGDPGGAPGSSSDSADEGDSGSTGAAGVGTDDTTGGRDPDDTSITAGQEDTGDTGEGTLGGLPHQESFDGPDGAAWPSPWAAAGSAVVSATLEEGHGRLVGATGNVARMVLPGFVESDIDVTVTVIFDDWSQQGFGLYVRQNGGALQMTDPPGQGYAAYVEGGWQQAIGIWRETNGVEELLQGVNVPDGALAAGVPYHLRLQCAQEGPATRLRTRIWLAGQPEPETWQVDMLDDTPVLQNVAGSFALDVYNYSGMGGVMVDDLHIAPHEGM